MSQSDRTVVRKLHHTDSFDWFIHDEWRGIVYLLFIIDQKYQSSILGLLMNPSRKIAHLQLQRTWSSLAVANQDVSVYKNCLKCPRISLSCFGALPVSNLILFLIGKWYMSSKLDIISYWQVIHTSVRQKTSAALFFFKFENDLYQSFTANFSFFGSSSFFWHGPVESTQNQYQEKVVRESKKLSRTQKKQLF